MQSVKYFGRLHLKRSRSHSLVKPNDAAGTCSKWITFSKFGGFCPSSMDQSGRPAALTVASLRWLKVLPCRARPDTGGAFMSAWDMAIGTLEAKAASTSIFHSSILVCSAVPLVNLLSKASGKPTFPSFQDKATSAGASTGSRCRCLAGASLDLSQCS